MHARLASALCSQVHLLQDGAEREDRTFRGRGSTSASWGDMAISGQVPSSAQTADAMLPCSPNGGRATARRGNRAPCQSPASRLDTTDARPGRERAHVGADARIAALNDPITINRCPAGAIQCSGPWRPQWLTYAVETRSDRREALRVAVPASAERAAQVAKQRFRCARRQVLERHRPRDSFDHLDLGRRQLRRHRGGDLLAAVMT
jgi:hypothetical protein